MVVILLVAVTIMTVKLVLDIYTSVYYVRKFNRVIETDKDKAMEVVSTVLVKEILKKGVKGQNED